MEHGWIFQLIQWKNTSIRNSRISNLVNFVSLTSGQLDDPGDDDDEEGEELGVGEDVLHSGCPLDLVEVWRWKIFLWSTGTHLVTVDEGEDTDTARGQQSEDHTGVYFSVVQLYFEMLLHRDIVILHSRFKLIHIYSKSRYIHSSEKYLHQSLHPSFSDSNVVSELFNNRMNWKIIGGSYESSHSIWMPPSE